MTSTLPMSASGAATGTGEAEAKGIHQNVWLKAG